MSEEFIDIPLKSKNSRYFVESIRFSQRCIDNVLWLEIDCSDTDIQNIFVFQTV